MALKYSYCVPKNLKPHPKPDVEMMWDVERELFDVLGDCCLFDHVMYGNPLMKDLIEFIIFNFEENKFPPWTLEILQNFHRTLYDKDFFKMNFDLVDKWIKKLELLWLYPSILEFDELENAFKARCEAKK